jgi:hypothetical protein
MGPRPDADAAVMISGNAFCQIYFRMGGLWNTPVDLDGLDHVVAQLLFRRFELRGHVSSHGSLRSNHMLVPLLCRRRIEADTVRSVDIHASVVRTIGGQNGHREGDGRPFTIAW